MKFLTLIRHAKSSHVHPGLRDIERPLNDRGREAAPAMGRWLAACGWFHPVRWVSSPAVRAMETAKAVAAVTGAEVAEIRQEPRIYEAPVSALLEVIREFRDAAGDVVMFGHNPGFEDLTNRLCGGRVVTGLKTMGVVRLELDVGSWGQVKLGRAKLREYTFPALIGAGNGDD